MPSLRRIYLYLVACISLIVLLAGLINLSAALIFQLLSPGRLAPLLPLGNTNLAIGDFRPWLALSGLALVIWALHWFFADQATRGHTMAGAEERRSAARKAYTYTGQFAALLMLLAEAGALIYSVLLVVMGADRALPELVDWPVRQVAFAVGAVLALLIWMYLRRVALSDDDFGHEQPAAAGWRRTYYYLAASLGFALAVYGAAALFEAALRLAGQRLLFGTPLAGTWQAPLATAVTALILGAPLSLLLWRRADWLAADDPTGAEVNAAGRKVLLYAGLLAGVGATLISAAALIMTLLRLYLGLPVDSLQALWEGTLIGPVAFLPVGLVLWWAFWRALRSDLEWAPESREAAGVRRLYFYVVAFLALLAFWYGLQESISVLLILLLRLQPPSALVEPLLRDFLSLAAGLLLTGGPTWGWHWRRAQGWARQPGPAGFEERASGIRRVYLYGVIFVSAIVAAGVLAYTIYRIVTGLADPTDRGGFATVAVQLGIGLALALMWWLTHAWVLRRDMQALAAEREAAAQAPLVGPLPAVDVAEPAEGDEPADDTAAPPWDDAGHETGSGEAPGEPDTGVAAEPAAPIEAPPVPPRPGRVEVFDRDRLEALRSSLMSPRPTSAPAGPSPSGAVAVIDGSDGSLGAALLVALRAALPDATLWPMGLNPSAQQQMAAALAEGGATGATGATGVPPPAPAAAPAVPEDSLAQAAAIVGPGDIVTPGGMFGEVPPELATAVAVSPARKVLLPPADPRLRWVAAPDWSVERWIEHAVTEVTKILYGTVGA